MTTATFKSHKFKLTSRYQKCRFALDTVDMQHLKSVTYTIKFWYTGDIEYYHMITKTMYKASKRIIDQYLDEVLLKKDFISVLNAIEVPRANPAFCEFEFTLFPTKKIGKGMIYEQLFSVISNRIYENLFKDNDVVKGTKGR